MARIVPFSKNRQAIYDLLTRAKRFHATTSTTLELDVGALYAALAAARAAGRQVGFVAALVKATSLVMVEHPRLNQHLFHGPLGKYAVDFEEVSANLIVMRDGEGGEKVLLPLVLRGSDRLSVDEITAHITHHQRAPLAELPAFAAVERLKRIPGPALRLFSYLSRADHRFYRKFFGTYGFSPLLHEDERGVAETSIGVAAHSLANTGSAFFPFAVADKPRVVDGRTEVRKVLSMMVAVDHFLVDGYDAVLAGLTLQKLLSRPERLGL